MLLRNVGLPFCVSAYGLRMGFMSFGIGDTRRCYATIQIVFIIWPRACVWIYPVAGFPRGWLKVKASRTLRRVGGPVQKWPIIHGFNRKNVYDAQTPNGTPI